MLTTRPFGQLFVANRFMKCNDSLQLKHFNDEETKILNLLRKQGFKKYMENDCNLKYDIDGKNEQETEKVMKTHNETIRNILNNIMCYYPKLYESITSYNKKNNEKYYDKVFNICQLVVYIFQYLHRYDIKHLINCSMVDSIWLIHSFHSNCTKYLRLPFGKLMELQKADSNDWGKYYCMRQWSRFSNTSSIRILMDKSSSTCNNVKRINFHNMSDICIMFFSACNSSSNTDDSDAEESQEGLKCFKQLTNIVCCQINDALAYQMNSKNTRKLRKPLSLEFVCCERYHLSQSATDVSILNASQYTKLRLIGTRLFCKVIIGEECQQLQIDDNISIDISQSNFSGIQTLSFIEDTTSIIQQFLSHEISCPKINDLQLEMFNKFDCALLFWKKHHKYLSNNNGKVSLEIDVEKIKSKININTNYIKKILNDIDNDGLSGNIYRLCISFKTVDGFKSIRDALISTRDFKSTVQMLYLSINTRNMVSTKLSNLFFHELDINTTANTSRILIPNLKYLQIDRWRDCSIDDVLDLFGIIAKYAKISGYEQVIWSYYCIHDILISINSNDVAATKSKIDELFNLMYEIVLVIKYPINMLLKIKFETNFDDKVSEEKAVNEMQKEFECFKNKLKSNYQPPSCQGLTCQTLTQPKINISMKQKKYSIHVETTDLPKH